jgi:hypothetical protein
MDQKHKPSLIQFLGYRQTLYLVPSGVVESFLKPTPVVEIRPEFVRGSGPWRVFLLHTATVGIPQPFAGILSPPPFPTIVENT